MLLPTRKDIDFALVVYDREAVLGMTVVQLADYAVPAAGRLLGVRQRAGEAAEAPVEP